MVEKGSNRKVLQACWQAKNVSNDSKNRHKSAPFSLPINNKNFNITRTIPTRVEWYTSGRVGEWVRARRLTCNCNNNDSINDDILSTIVNNVSASLDSSHHNLSLFRTSTRVRLGILYNCDTECFKERKQTSNCISELDANEMGMMMSAADNQMCVIIHWCQSRMRSFIVGKIVTWKWKISENFKVEHKKQITTKFSINWYEVDLFKFEWYLSNVQLQLLE